MTTISNNIPPILNQFEILSKMKTICQLSSVMLCFCDPFPATVASLPKVFEKQFEGKLCIWWRQAHLQILTGFIVVFCFLKKKKETKGSLASLYTWGETFTPSSLVNQITEFQVKGSHRDYYVVCRKTFFIFQVCLLIKEI